MNHRAKHLPEHWQKYVENHPQLKKGELTKEFNGSIHINWEDGSHVYFNYAFLVWDEDRNEIGVFTEHCGYYFFSTVGLDFSSFDRKKALKIKKDKK